MVLCDNRHWIARLGQRLQATTSQLQFALDRLVTIGHSAHGDDLRLPFWRSQFPSQQLRRVLLHHDLGFEVEAGGEAEEFVERARVAIDATVLAAAIRIHAGFEAHIRAVVVIDDGVRVVPEELRRRRRFVGVVPVRVRFQRDLLEAVRRILDGATGAKGWRIGLHFSVKSRSGFYSKYPFTGIKRWRESASPAERMTSAGNRLPA